MNVEKLYQEVKCKGDLGEFEKGLRMEAEHRNLFDGSEEDVDKKLAMIVKQHLMEDDEYYTKISKILGGKEDD